MKTVTADFGVVQGKEDAKIIRRVYYKRRYWNAGSSSYIWESSWTEIPQDELLGVDAIVHALDTLTFNQFLVSNTVLRVRNDKLQWKEGTHDDSKFKPDGTSSFGYIPYLMKFQVRAGYANVGEKDLRAGVRTPGVDDGHEELLTIFTGVGVEFWTDSDQRIAYIRATGLEELLYNADAENVSTLVTNEVVGTGDGVKLEFSTANVGVGRVLSIASNGTEQPSGLLVEVSNLNDPEEGALITFLDPPDAGEEITVTYRYWKKDRIIKDLIQDLLNEAGIASSSIENVDFGALSALWVQTSKSDFDAGTKTDIDTGTQNGAFQMPAFVSHAGAKILLDDFSGGIGAWTQTQGTAWSGSGGKASHAAAGSSVIRQTYGRNIAIGTWQFKFQLQNTTLQTFRFVFMGNQDGNSFFNGYDVAIGGQAIASNNPGIEVHDSDASSTAAIASDTSITFDTNEHTVTITRDYLGTIKVYYDGVLKITVVDTTHTFGDRVLIQGINNSGTGQPMTVDDVYIPPATITSTLVSKVLDTGVGPSAWGTLQYKQFAFGGTITYTTRASADAISWDAYLALGGGDSIQSDVKRYLQVKAVLSISSAGLNRPPIVYYFRVNFTVTLVGIVLANFTGLSCYQAIQELAKLTDYEWGFDDNETFFFRNRDSSPAADMVLTSGINLSEISALLNGYDRAFSKFRAQFGSFLAEDAAAAGQRTSNQTIFKDRVFSISSNMLINKSTNLAKALVSVYKNRFGGIRRRVKILTKFLPQLELSDRVEVNYNHGPNDTPYLNALPAKIIYTRQDPDNKVTELEVEEILS